MSITPIVANDTISNQVAEALETTLAAYLIQWLPYTPFELLREVKEPTAMRTPTITALNKGYVIDKWCAAGQNTDGTRKPGAVQRRYSFDLQICEAGPDEQTIREMLRSYGDAVVASIEQSGCLGLSNCFASASRGNETDTFRPDGAGSLMAYMDCPVLVTVGVLSGSTSL
jgi:hypothetical protein